MSRSDDAPSVPSPRRASQSVYRTIGDVLLTGFTVIIPLVVTLYILKAAFDFVTGVLDPLITVLQYVGAIERVKEVGFVDLLIRVGIYENASQFLTELIAGFLLLSAIVVVGVVARNRYGEQLIMYFDSVIAAFPGIGAIYKSFRRMGDVIVESEVENFRDVKLVEFPRDGTYVVGFETNEAPDTIRETTENEEMYTLFLPLAPNPVMGGFLAHIPADRVLDVDMTVEEGIRSVITSGIATPDDPAEDKGVSLEDATPLSLDDIKENWRRETDGSER